MLDFEYRKTAISLGGLFEFETPASECFPEQRLRVDMTYEYPLKIKTKAKKDSHRYCFTTNEGLVDVSKRKTKEEIKESVKAFNRTRESNIITNIPATATLKNKIKYYSNKNTLRLNRVSFKDREELEEKQKMLLDSEFSKKEHTETLTQYIRDFGYLLTPPKDPRKINIEILSAFYDRLYALIILITELNKSQAEMDYNTLFYCTTFLANAKQVSLTSYSKDKDEEVLSNCHEFGKVWKNAENIKVDYIRDGYDPDEKEISAIEEGKIKRIDIDNPYLWTNGKLAKRIGLPDLPEDATARDDGKCTFVYDSIYQKTARLSFYTTNDFFKNNTY